jgi:alanyl-tRNA synthetase
MKSSEIREKFLNYFTHKGHELVASSSLVPANDPTLLFTNAGMVQFKETFLGIESRAYTRATTSQRCVRAGGKHNDLENVGYTARHHTFFEMLGNFSFGDYFKREAINYAWDFLTNHLNLPAEKLWVTVYTDDDEAADIWLNELKVSPERFSRCGEKDNFWSMGDTGPCGPCTEIFYDHGPEIAGGPPGTPEEDGDRYIEIWNLVFMQYNRDKSGTLTPLPKPSVDTGMGLERLAAVVQGVHSNYEIDLFQELIQTICSLGSDIDSESASVNVIADHIRSCAFLIVDGVIPSNEGRGYVLRRIIRRAVRHGHKLGINETFFYKLVSRLADLMGDAYPELVKQRAHIERILKQEEQQFERTLEQGLKLLNEEIQTLENKIINGALAFKLYDTYGFPLDLTADIAREHQLTVDQQEFDALMQNQRDKSKASTHFDIDYNETQGIETETLFVGYQNNEISSNIELILDGNQQIEEASQGMKLSIILHDTPFYAESGGQVGDSGTIECGDSLFDVEDTQKIGKAFLHHGVVKQGTFQLGDKVIARINTSRRDAIRLNHSATHLLHAALKNVLGEHVQQKGSLVDATRARFDFSHYEAMTTAQLRDVENLVNAQIRQNNEVLTEIMTPDDAKKAGALALFGEKYDSKVRVLTMGEFSKELCGGTHVTRTGDIGVFKIVSESGIAAGIRRIEMVTGSYALAWMDKQLQKVNEIGALLKTDSTLVVEKVSQFLQENRKLEKELQRLQDKLASQSGDDLLKNLQQVADVNVLAVKLDGADPKSLRTTLDQVKSKIDDVVVVLVAVNDKKMNVVAGVSSNLIGRVPSAKLLVQHICGKGGGRDDMAQGGGRVEADLDAKLAGISEIVAQHLG